MSKLDINLSSTSGDVVYQEVPDGEQNNNRAVSLAPRESSTFPYRRFAQSPMVVKSIRKMSGIKAQAQNLKAEYDLNSGMEGNVNQPVDFVERLNFDELFTLMDQFVEYMGYFRTNPDEATLHSVKTTLDKLETIIKEFELHSVEPLRSFCNKMQRILSTYHRSTDVVGYIVDLTGTYSIEDKEPAIAYTNKALAQELIAQEGNDDSRLHEIYANVVSRGDRTSRKVDDCLWLVAPGDIFSCSVCAY